MKREMSLQNYLNINSYETSFEEEQYAEYIDNDSRSNHFDQNNYDSEEDTDDASETEFRHNNRHHHYNNNNTNSGNNINNNGSNHELKEQMYQHKLENLNKQMDELKESTHPEYMKRIKKLDNQCKERLRLNESYRDYLKDCVERDYVLEQKAALKEYDEKKIDLKDNILTDFEERKKVIENERYSLELTNDSTEIKPTVTRKLRRRPNEPVPVVEKRRKPTTGQLVIYLLDEKDVDHDLKLIQRGKPLTPSKLAVGQQSLNFNDSFVVYFAIQQNEIASFGNHSQHGALLTDNSTHNYVETRIEDGKLLYERRWFHRGQQVYVEGKEVSKFAATVTAIGNEVVWVKKVNDNKFKINMSQLAKGKISIKRRAN